MRLYVVTCITNLWHDEVRIHPFVFKTVPQLNRFLELSQVIAGYDKHLFKGDEFYDSTLNDIKEVNLH